MRFPSLLRTGRCTTSTLRRVAHCQQECAARMLHLAQSHVVVVEDMLKGQAEQQKQKELLGPAYSLEGENTRNLHSAVPKVSSETVYSFKANMEHVGALRLRACIRKPISPVDSSKFFFFNPRWRGSILPMPAYNNIYSKRGIIDPPQCQCEWRFEEFFRHGHAQNSCLIHETRCTMMGGKLRQATCSSKRGRFFCIMLAA